MAMNTARLNIRAFEMEDLSLVYEINNHPECIRFNKWNSMALDECSSVLKKWIDETALRKHYGVYCVSDHTGKAVGMTFLMKYEWTEDYEVGFRLKRDQWEKGYAAELTGFWIDYCQSVLHANSIRAEVAGDNQRSLKIFRRLDFEELEHPGGGGGRLFIKLLKREA